MEKYKNDFAIRFAQLMQKNLSRWKKFQNTYRRNLYTRYVKYYFIAFCVGFVPGKHERNYVENLEIHFWFGVFLFISAIILAIVFTNKEYQDRIKGSLFPSLLEIFSEKIRYPGLRISKADYDLSELFTKPVTRSEVDDTFSGIYNNVPFKINETTLINITYSKNKKEKPKTTELFDGIAMQFTMQKEINARVLIYSKSIFNRIPEGYEKVVLEYEKFNKKYDLYVQKNEICEGQIEARYLFNTVFLDRFMQLQTSFRVSKMECSIYKNNILVLLETQKDLFELNHLLGKLEDISQHNRLFDEFASVLSFIDVLNLSSRTGL
ncbi:DUF3137 domain-containing protein [bacterium]|nr:DUF3137 domain-containing protein [bacterium]